MIVLFVQLTFSERPADVKVLQRPSVSGPALRVVPAVGVRLQRDQGNSNQTQSHSIKIVDWLLGPIYVELLTVFNRITRPTLSLFLAAAALACCAAMVFSVGRRAGLAPPTAVEDDEDVEAILEVELHRDLLAARLQIFKGQSC